MHILRHVASIFEDIGIEAISEKWVSMLSEPFISDNICRTDKSPDMAAWSRGMIRVSGARGRGFDSRSSPSFFEGQK